MDFDVRNSDQKINKIIFADEGPTSLSEKAHYISRSRTDSGIWVGSLDRSVRISNDDINNLILALKKAKELGWIPSDSEI